jgi:hypothetical protein
LYSAALSERDEQDATTSAAKRKTNILFIPSKLGDFSLDYAKLS